MNKSDIQRLQSLTGFPRISILLPTHRTSPDNKRDPIVLENLLKDAGRRLKEEFSGRQCEALMDRLRHLAGRVEQRNNTEGLALFASEDHAEWHRLPFAVEARVAIDETYATRDLVYAFNRSPRYRVLVLSAKTTRLYEGVHERLDEIENSDFPRPYADPDSGQPLPSGRGVDSEVAHQLLGRFLAEVDEALDRIFQPDPLPFVACGVERILARFQAITRHGELLAGDVEGSHERTPANDLGAKTRPVIDAWLKVRRDRVFERLEQATGANRAAAGLQECWRVASEGRVDTLLVEEDFRVPGRVNQQGTLVPVDDSGAPGIIDDAVDELIETVLAASGQVVFFSPGRLAGRDRIAAILRY